MKIKNLLKFTLIAAAQISQAHALSSNLARDMMLKNVTNSGATSSPWTLYQDPDMSGNPLKYTLLTPSSTCQWSTYFPDYTCWQGDVNKDVLTGFTNVSGLFPKGTVIFHPRVTKGPVVGWKASYSKTVNVIYALSDMSTTCGDGVSWNLRYQGLIQKSGVINGGVVSGTLTLYMQAGESVYLTVGANGNESCDTTAVEMQVITPLTP